MTTMMLEVPSALKDMLPALRDLLDEVSRQIESTAGLAPTTECEQFETRLRKRISTLEQRAHGLRSQRETWTRRRCPSTALCTCASAGTRRRS